MALSSTLPEDLVEEILLRIPPDEPADLVYAALVCKVWRRIILSYEDHGFLRRYRSFHRRPPLLGYISNHYNPYYNYTLDRFIPICKASPVSPTAFQTLGYYQWGSVLDCRHGRVLIHTYGDGQQPERLIIWNPISGAQEHLSVPTNWHVHCTGYVLCANASDGCDHLDCSGGPFLVVFVWTRMQDVDDMLIWARIYSSETDEWSAPTSINSNLCRIYGRPGVLIGDVLYLTVDVNDGIQVLKYDLRKHELSVVDTPRVVSTTLVTKGEGGGLRLINLSENCIYMWSQQDVTNGVGAWVKHKVMEELQTLLPLDGGSCPGKVIGFIEGTSIILTSIYAAGIFALNLKSRQVRKVCERYYESYPMYPISPYMSFYIPK